MVVCRVSRSRRTSSSRQYCRVYSRLPNRAAASRRASSTRQPRVHELLDATREVKRQLGVHLARDLTFRAPGESELPARLRSDADMRLRQVGSRTRNSTPMYCLSSATSVLSWRRPAGVIV